MSNTRNDIIEATLKQSNKKTSDPFFGLTVVNVGKNYQNACNHIC